MLEKENLEKLDAIKKDLANTDADMSGGAYNIVKKNLQELATKTLKGKNAYLAKIKLIMDKLENLTEAYAKNGQSKVSSKFGSLIGKMLSLSNRIEAGKVKDVDSIKATADSVLRSLEEINPKAAEQLHEKAGIRDQRGSFAKFNKARVSIGVDRGKKCALLNAPLLLLFKNKVLPSQKRVLTALNAHFYQGTNAVSVPDVPILVLNDELISKEERPQMIQAIFRRLHRPDLVPIMELAVTKRNATAIPVFDKSVAEVIAGLVSVCQSYELWVS